MSKDTGHHDHGIGVGGYTFIAVVLAIITYAEYYIVEHPIMPQGWTMFWLIALSIAKFILVVAYFMHLKQDDRTYTGFFSSGMVIAMGTFIALALVFSVESLFWTVQLEEEAHHELVAVADVAHAEELYHHYCATCHGENGLGIARAVPPHAVHAPLLLQAEGGVGGRAYMIHTVLYGLEGEIEALGETYNGIMPSRYGLSDRYVAEILNYTVSAFGNDAYLPEDFTPFTADEVAAARNQDLTTLDIFAQRQELEVPEVEGAALPRRYTLDRQSWRPPPKDLALFLSPAPEITDSRTPIGPETDRMEREEAGPPTPWILLTRPDYEEPGDETGIEAVPAERELDAPGFANPQDEEQDFGDDAPDAAEELEAEDAPTEQTDLFDDSEGQGDEDPEGPGADELQYEPGPDVREPEDAAEVDAEADTAEAGLLEEVRTLATEAEGEPSDAEAEVPAETEDTEPTTEEEAVEAPDAELTPEPIAAVEAEEFDWQSLGEATFANCSSCHGVNGQGIPGAFPPLVGHTAELYTAEGGREYLINVLLYGLQGEITVDGVAYNGIMPAWVHLSNEQVAAVINHIVAGWEGQDDVADFEAIQPSEVEAERNQNLSPADVHDMRQDLNLE